MTPIKVGNLTVFASADGGYIVARPAGPDDAFPGAVSTEVTLHVGIAYPRTLPMALRVAAEAAGIERQRVRLARDEFGIGWVTRSADGTDYIAGKSHVGDSALRITHTKAEHLARERYAALGGAA